jgi:hypothetical protein
MTSDLLKYLFISFCPVRVARDNLDSVRVTYITNLNNHTVALCEQVNDKLGQPVLSLARALREVTIDFQNRSQETFFHDPTVTSSGL